MTIELNSIIILSIRIIINATAQVFHIDDNNQRMLWRVHLFVHVRFVEQNPPCSSPPDAL